MAFSILYIPHNQCGGAAADPKVREGSTRLLFETINGIPVVYATVASNWRTDTDFVALAIHSSPRSSKSLLRGRDDRWLLRAGWSK